MVAYSRIALGPEFDGLADDTAVSLLGSGYHQEALLDAYLGLQRYRRQRDLPWFIGRQARLSIPRGEGTRYTPAPDLFIHATLGPCPLATVSVANYGPPTLVIEVVSGTMPLDNDLRVGTPGGKAAAYAASGVAEYLVFDPCGDSIPEGVAAWRLGPGRVYVPWKSNAADRWTSSLGIAFAPRGAKLRVYDEAGALMPSYEELADLAEEQEREIAALRRLRGEGDER